MCQVGPRNKDLAAKIHLPTTIFIFPMGPWNNQSIKSCANHWPVMLPSPCNL
ncbi:hypothetical protein Hanom_Chr12g01135171 [Helianthus anomalus]